MYEVTYTTVVGDFDGWGGDMQYFLQDGTCWQMAYGHETLSYRFEPRAQLLHAGGTHFLAVEDEGFREVSPCNPYAPGAPYKPWGSDLDEIAALLRLRTSPMYQRTMKDDSSTLHSEAAAQMPHGDRYA